MKENKYFIAKISNRENNVPLHDKDALRERARGFWKVSTARLNETRNMLLLFNGTVIGAYTIGSKILLDQDARRVKFELTDVDSHFIGKRLDYPTANPISIAPESKLIIKS